MLLDINKMFQKNSQAIRKGPIIKSETLKININHTISEQDVLVYAPYIYRNYCINRNLRNIVFNINTIKFNNKLSYILLECLVYASIVKLNKNVFFSWMNAEKKITVNGFENTALFKYINREISMENFAVLFEKDILSLSRYRRIVEKEEKNDIFGRMMGDIKGFLKNHFIAKNNYDNMTEYIDKISEISVELVSNAWEHSNSDCLIDIDITDDNWQKDNDEENNNYYGINLIVLNFSDKLLGYGIKNKMNHIINNKPPKEDEIFSELIRAYGYHNKFFSKNYLEEDFFNISAFQNKISGRIGKYSGGTGLTQVLYFLLNQADLGLCNVLSGNRGLDLSRAVSKINADNEEWFGFNQTQNFFTGVPDKDIIINAANYFPGSAFGLNLVYKKDD